MGMASMLDLEENQVPAGLVALGGFSLFVSACIFWNIVYEDAGKDPSSFDAYDNAVNTDVFCLIVFAGLCAANVLTRHKGCAEVALIGSTGALFYLFAGINAGGHQPWTSLGHVNMIRAWREAWDSADGVGVPTWTKKALAAGVFAMMGYVLSYGAVVAKLTAGDAGPLSEKISPNRKAFLQVATIVTAVAAFLGCICVWATKVAGSPDGYGDLLRIKGAMYQPNKDETYDMLTYGNNKDSRSTTEYDLYVLTMSITSCTLLTVVLTAAMMATTSRPLASIVTYMSLSNGWSFLTHASLFKYGVGDAMNEGDRMTVSTGIIFCWVASMASLAASCIVLELHSGQSNRVGADQSSDPLNHLRNSFSTGGRFNPLANNPGLQHERSEPRPSVDNLPKLKADVSPKPVKKTKPGASPKPSPKVARKAKPKRADKKAKDDEKKAEKEKEKEKEKGNGNGKAKEGENNLSPKASEGESVTNMGTDQSDHPAHTFNSMAQPEDAAAPEAVAKATAKPSPLATTVETAAPAASNDKTVATAKEPEPEPAAVTVTAVTAVAAVTPTPAAAAVAVAVPVVATAATEPAAEAATDPAATPAEATDKKMEVSNL